jgi:subtilisin family serine protease
MALREKRLPALSLAALAVVSFIPGAPPARALRPVTSERAAAGSASAVRGAWNPKLQYRLARLYDIFKIRGAEEARNFASPRKIMLDGGMVQVVVESADRPVPLSSFPAAQVVKNIVTTAGGKVEAIYENLVLCRVPVAELESFAGHPLVRYVRLPLKPVPQVVSEGVARIGADLWRSLNPFRTVGTGANVAVLDVGFRYNDQLRGSELPSTVTIRSFRSDNNVQSDIHGTACAEIIHDVAPDANLWLVQFSNDVEQHLAVNWLLTQKIDVISYSIGWFNAGDGRGTGPICDDVAKAARYGVLWAGAAGNYADAHFKGVFNDPDNDGWFEFPDGNEFLRFWLPAGTEVGAYMNWDDWGDYDGFNYSGSGQDYDLYFYIWENGAWRLVDESAEVQAGSDWPTEGVSGTYNTSSTWGAIRIFNRSTTRPCTIEAFIDGCSGAVANNVPESSLLIPGDAEASITIGAVDAGDDSYHEYSSQGPTKDGRIKPEICAPSGVSTSYLTFGSRAAGLGFYGTSAATPHVAGALALLKQKTPYTRQQILDIIYGRVIDLGEPGMDTVFGRGRLNIKKK